MGTDKNNSEWKNDEKRQYQDHDSGDQASDSNKNQKITGNPERLQDSAHRMDNRINDVQGEVDYGQNRYESNEASHRDLEGRWKAIQTNYRKRYPEITDDDVNYNAGELDAMIHRISERTNRNPEDVNKEIINWDNLT